MRLKIFIEKQSLLEKVKTVPLLFPFLGLPDWSLYHDSKFNREAFNTFLSLGHEMFELTDLENCDFIVFPYDLSLVNNDRNKFINLIEFYSKASIKSGKPVLVFCEQDPEFEVSQIKPFENYYLFHTSFFKSLNTSKKVFAYPFFINDTVDTHKAEKCRPINQPSVSFCGYAPPLGIGIFNKRYYKEKIKLSLFEFRLHKIFRFNPRQEYRAAALKNILRSNKLEKNIIIRNFSGFDGRKGMFVGNNDDFYNKIRKEYFENINSSDYVLCARGNGNYSIRFYEALCHGKIPIFIDSDTPLPFHQFIDWSKHAIIIKEDEIRDIEKKILKFHEVNSQNLKKIKIENRRIWENYLTPEGFFSKIYLYLGLKTE